MAIENRITFQPIPKVEQSGDYVNEDRDMGIPTPEGSGWRLAYSMRGEFNICHVWKKGGIQYDRGYENTWTSKGDDIINNKIGEGSIMVLSNEVGVAEKEVTFEFIPKDTYMFGGAISWEGAGTQDALTIDVIATATSVSTGGNLSVIVVDDKIVPVDAGTGTHEITGMPTVVDNKSNTGYWNFDSGSLVEAPNQDGNIDLYTVDKVVARLVNYLPTIPTTYYGHSISSENAWKILPGYKFKFRSHNVSNTEWSASMTLSMIRRKTVDY